MRLLSLLAVLLLIALPLSGAQQGCGEDGCDPEDARGGRPGSDGGGPDQNRTADGNETTGHERCEEDPAAPGCQGARERTQRERFRQNAEGAAAESRHLSFEVDPHNRTLFAYAVDGHVVFDALRLEDPGEFSMDQRGSVLRLRTNESVLRLHDAPRGNVDYESGNHSIVLDLPPGAFLDRHGKTERGHFLLIDYGGHTGKLAADRLVIEGDLLRLSGHAAFHVEAKPPQAPEATPVRQEMQDALAEAEENRQLGARVAIRPGPPGALAMADGDSDGDVQAGAAVGSDVEVTAYDDLEVEVTLPERLGPNQTIDVIVGAELDEGRTVALELDPAVLAGLSIGQGGDAAPRYYDLNDDGTWTEVVFRKADGIHDILDAQDDAGQPEYWIVEDEQGTQVLVSFPHWSVHRVSLVLEEVVEFVTQPSVLVGVVAGVGGVLVAAATLFLPRRREEDLY